MAVGTILTVSPQGQIIHREPIWPWPKPETYPRKEGDNTLLFFPKPYYNFPLGDFIHEDTCN